MLFTLIASSMTTGYCYSNTVASKGNNVAAQKANSNGSSYIAGMTGLGIGTGSGYGTYKLMTYGKNKLNEFNSRYEGGAHGTYWEFGGDDPDFLDDRANPIRKSLDDLGETKLDKLWNEVPFRIYTDTNGQIFLISENVPADLADAVFVRVVDQDLVNAETNEVLTGAGGRPLSFSGIMCEYHNALFSRVMKIEGDGHGYPQNPIMVQFNFNPALQPYVPYIILGISALAAVAVIAFIYYIAG